MASEGLLTARCRTLSHGPGAVAALGDGCQSRTCPARPRRGPAMRGQLRGSHSGTVIGSRYLVPPCSEVHHRHHRSWDADDPYDQEYRKHGQPPCTKWWLGFTILPSTEPHAVRNCAGQSLDRWSTGLSAACALSHRQVVLVDEVAGVLRRVCASRPPPTNPRPWNLRPRFAYTALRASASCCEPRGMTGRRPHRSIGGTPGAHPRHVNAAD